MNEPSHERDELRALVRDLGIDTERRAPAFEAVWRAAQQSNQANDAPRRHGPAPRAWMFAVGLVAAACLTIMVYHNLSTRTIVKSVEHKSEAGVEWTPSLEPESPTDFLLAGTSVPEGGRLEKLYREINDLLQP